MSAPVQSARAASALRRYVVVVSLASLSALGLLILLEGDTLVGRIRVFRRSAEGELTLSTAFSFAVLLDGGALAACAVLAVASVAADIHARKPAARVWFNAAQYVLSM